MKKGESSIISDRVKPKTVDEYIALYPEADQAGLQAIREKLRQTLPEATERITYNMPLVEQDGQVMWYANFKNHFSLFVPAIDRVQKEFAEELAGYVIEKATIKLPKSKPLPLDLIARIATFVAAENRSAVSSSEGES